MGVPNTKKCLLNAKLDDASTCQPQQAVADLIGGGVPDADLIGGGVSIEPRVG